MELTSPFQLLASPFEPCTQPSRPPSPCRVVGFDSACSSATSSPSSVLEGLDSRQLSCQAPSVTGERLPSQPLLRTSSLGQQLRQQAALQLQPPSARLSIRTRSAAAAGGGSGRGLSLARARSSQLPTLGAAMAPAAAAATLDPCAATLPSAGGMALVRQQSAAIEIPNRLHTAKACPKEELDDDLIAAAVEACAAAAPPALPPPAPLSYRSGSPWPSPSPPSSGGLVGAPARSRQGAAWGFGRGDAGGPGNLSRQSSGASAAGSGLQRADSATTSQEQLFAAHAAAAQSQAQVACLHEALGKERVEVQNLRAQLRSMALERDQLRQEAAEFVAAADAARSSGLMRGMQATNTQTQVGRAPEFTSPFGGFSPFTPGRDESESIQ